MNDLIRWLDACDLSKTVYDVFFALGFVSVFLWVVLTGRKMKVPVSKSAITVLIVYPTVVAWMFILCWMETGFRNFGGNNIVRVFVYVPVVGYPVAKLLKISWKKILSMLAFGPAAVHSISHLGCIFEGCCRGYPSQWGIYNIRTEGICFPIPIIEVLIAWGVLFYLLFRAKKRNFIPDGKEYFLMLILFGSTRFICEFFRDNEKIFLGCSSLAFHALFMVVVGVIALLIIKRKGIQPDVDTVSVSTAD